MSTKYAKVAFVHKKEGYTLEGEYVADGGPTWMVAVDGKVRVPLKSEWESKPVAPSGFSDLSGGGFR